MIKPTESFQKSVADKKNENQFESTLTGVAKEQAFNMYYTKSSSGYIPVNININQVYGDVQNDDGTTFSYLPEECLPLQIVTNLTSYQAGGNYYPRAWKAQPEDSGDSNSLGGIEDSNQFSLSLSNVKPNSVLDGQTRKAYAETIGDDSMDSEHKPLLKSDGKVADSIVTYMNDTNIDGRLYNITVTYKDPSGETTYLTGAKGAE